MKVGGYVRISAFKVVKTNLKSLKIQNANNNPIFVFVFLNQLYDLKIDYVIFLAVDFIYSHLVKLLIFIYKRKILWADIFTIQDRNLSSKYSTVSRRNQCGALEERA